MAGSIEATAQVKEEALDHEHAIEWEDAARIAFVALAAAAVWFKVWEPFSAFSLVGVLGLLIGGWPIFKEAWVNAVARRMTMELSMTLAIIAAAAISEFFTALVITLFVLAAEVLEGMTVSRGRRAIRDLLDFLPRSVSVRRSGGVEEMPAEKLSVGDAVLVNPGGRIPVDGIVLSGHSFVDQAPITGESMPVEKTPGVSVYAGSINQSGALEIRAERLGRDTSFGKIIEAVERAEHSRAPVQRLADRLSGYLVYLAMGAAAFTYLFTRNIHSTISVIIVAGACGVAAGTPLAILGGIGRAARSGAIIKGGLYLELLGKVDTIVFDKTGTLTSGTPSVQAIVTCDGISSGALLELAAAAEFRSEHPIAKAIVAYAGEQGLGINEPERFGYTPGRGVYVTLAGHPVLVGNRALMRDSAIEVPDGLLADYMGFSEVLVARGNRLLGAIAIADTIRPEARRAVEAIHRLGIKTLLLTGDAKPVGDRVASSLGVQEVVSDLLPEEKRRHVKELMDGSRIVAMVGDGINDAPAMAAASIGIAMGSGAEVARESADVVLLGNDLVKFVETLMIARRTRSIIWQNFVGTVAVDAIGIGLAAFGFLNPLLAAFIHVASELTFIFNSARLLSGVGRPRTDVNVGP